MTSSSSHSGPGKLLQDARENRNISIAEVSERLKLSKGIVESIEADDLASLPAPAFVRGYLRSYALLVDLDPNHIIERYHAVAPSDPALANISSVSGPKQGMDPIMLWVTVTIALLLLALFILWTGGWYKSYLAKNKVVVNGATPEQIIKPYHSPRLNQESNNPRDLPLDDLLSSEQILSKALDQPLPGERLSDVLHEQSSIAITKTDARALEGTGHASDVRSAIESTKSPAQEVSSSLSKPESDLNTVPIAPKGNDELLLLANGESWVNVTDANGYRLMYRMIEELEQVLLRGQAPFNVVLGASPNVTVSINGLEYDHSAFTRANLSAKFILRPQN